MCEKISRKQRSKFCVACHLHGDTDGLNALKSMFEYTLNHPFRLNLATGTEMEIRLYDRHGVDNDEKMLELK